jgi:hypothetical protein
MHYIYGKEDKKKMTINIYWFIAMSPERNCFYLNDKCLTLTGNLRISNGKRYTKALKNY